MSHSAAAETPRDRSDRTRAELGALYDRQMAPMGLVAMEALAPVAGETILDVGCGSGETIVQLVHCVGSGGRVIGVDIGRHVLTVARERTAHLANVTLVQQDAAILDLPDASVDAIYSRFGTMFFADPVAGFANLRRMLRPGGRIAFVCWRSLRENELDHFPLDASGLGMDFDRTSLSFERSEVIERVLATAGFGQIVIVPSDLAVSVGDADATLHLVTRVGPLGIILRENPDLRADVEPRLRAALADRECGNEVTFSAATWIVSACVG